jgi:hypothetical protein
MAITTCRNTWKLSLQIPHDTEQRKERVFQPHRLPKEIPHDSETSDASEIEEESSNQIQEGCYLKHGTLVADANSDYKSVSSLQVGDFVKGSFGKLLKTTFKKEHERVKRKLTTIRTAVAELTVASDHRIVVRVGGVLCEKLAMQVDVGDFVMGGTEPRRVAKVMTFEKRVELVELRFSPDHPIEAFMLPNAGIQTKGALDPLLIQLPTSACTVFERNTFLNVQSQGQSNRISDRVRRSRSAD